jgi:hypothetical protein
MGFRVVLRVAVGALALLACNRVAGEDGKDGKPALIELRDAAGALRLAVYRTTDGYRWVDAKEGSGRISGAVSALRASDPQLGLLDAVAGADGSLEVHGPGGKRLDLRRVDGLLRLGDGKGIPMARVAGGADGVVAHGPGGEVASRASRAGGRVVVAGAAGTAAFISGDVTLERAALVVLPALTAAERVLLLLAQGP